MQPIGNLLDSALHRAHIREQVDATRVLEEARVALLHVCGEAMAEAIVPRSLRDGVLTMACRSAAAASHVKEKAEVLRQEIVRALPTAPIHTISPRIVSSTHQSIAWYDLPT